MNKAHYLKHLDIPSYIQRKRSSHIPVHNLPSILIGSGDVVGATSAVYKQYISEAATTHIFNGDEYISTPASTQAAPAPSNKPHLHIAHDTDWTTWTKNMQQCRACSLATQRKNVVIERGIAPAVCMLIGEAPGEQEDQLGMPFIGRAGSLLDAILHRMGLSQDVYICNTVKCRPPNNRAPLTEELHACQGFLRAQHAHVQPKLVVALGRVAAQHLLQSQAPLHTLREQMWTWQETPLIVTYHPAYLLRQPQEKAKAWQDWQKIHRFLHPPTLC